MATPRRSTRLSTRLSSITLEAPNVESPLRKSKRKPKPVPKPAIIVISDSEESDCNSYDFKKPTEEIKATATDAEPNCDIDKKETNDVNKNMVPEIYDSSTTVKSNKISTPPTPKKKLDINYAELEMTPPKQRKTVDENKLLSPSSLFKQLDINSPKKEKSSAHAPYRNARKALHSSVPVCMPGREKEHTRLKVFIKEHLDEQKSGILYISGPPGTGKTASLSSILQEEKFSRSFKEIYVNCTSIKSSGAIYARIAKELDLKTGKSEKDCLAALDKHFSSNHKMILLVLDEIDQLESKNQSVLYTIFEWPSRPKSKIILIGIANALDLTDRTLPRLQAQCAMKPELMHFAPYTKQQIVDIFTNRLKEAGVLDLFSPIAIQMLAGKVASISGDVRKALDIGRRVIEIAEQKQSALQTVDSNAQNKDVQVGLKHVVGVLDTVYGTTSNLTEEADESFPLQQKIVICSLLLILKKARNKDVTVGRLHEVYRKVSTKRNILPVDQAEFVGLCQLIETRGIIQLVGKKEPRMHKVNLEWDQEEVAAALKDKQLLSTILQDTTALGKM